MYSSTELRAQPCFFLLPEVGHRHPKSLLFLCDCWGSGCTFGAAGVFSPPTISCHSNIFHFRAAIQEGAVIHCSPGVSYRTWLSVWKDSWLLSSSPSPGNVSDRRLLCCLSSFHAWKNEWEWNVAPYFNANISYPSGAACPQVLGQLHKGRREVVEA